MNENTANMKMDDLVKSHQNDGFLKSSPAPSGIPPLAGDFLRNHQNCSAESLS